MATYLENLLAIRDGKAAIIAGEVARVAAIVAAGHPPPTTYSDSKGSWDWNAWHAQASADLAKWIEICNEAGADGGIIDGMLRGYV